MSELTHERLLTLICYNPLSGNFWWPDHARKCGTKTWDGYISIMIDRQHYLAHRLAWFYVYGAWPPFDIDHEDRDRTNNRIKNLREATKSENAQNQIEAHSNNQTGYLGVIPVGVFFRATIEIEGSSRNLGTYFSAEMAHKVYVANKKRLHPFSES